MILDQIVSDVKQRLETDKTRILLRDLQEAVRSVAARPSFYSALVGDKLKIIAEIKKASPSAGDIDLQVNPGEKASHYSSAGAAALSVLTERDHFKGELKDLKQVSTAVNLPLLRKDFIFDPYQIYEAKTAGASAFLLIAAILEKNEIMDLMQLGQELKMDTLLEVHNENELHKAIECKAKIIGINNRNLRSFQIDLNTSLSLKSEIPSGILTVSESGIKSVEDMKRCKSAGFNAVLVGETLMKINNLRQLKSFIE